MALPESLRAKICFNKQTIRVKKKQTFIFPDNKIIIVRSGVIIPCSIRDDGKEKGLSIKTPGTLLGASQMFSDKDVVFNIYVISNFEGCALPVKFFENMFENDIEFAKQVLRAVSNNLTRHSGFTSELALSDSKTKVQLLVNMINSLKSEFPGIEMTHEEMSVLLGLNRVTVTKQISNIKKTN